jgi:hypothetical protein
MVGNGGVQRRIRLSANNNTLVGPNVNDDRFSMMKYDHRMPMDLEDPSDWFKSENGQKI